MATATTREEKATEIEARIPNFYGTAEYHRFNALFRRHLLTDGAKMIAEAGGAYWLMDAIASHHAAAMRDPMLQGIQFWTLKVKDGEAVLTCDRDEGDTAIRQEIPFTDFPLDEIKLYVTPAGDGNMVIMLPGEY